MIAYRFATFVGIPLCLTLTVPGFSQETADERGASAIAVEPDVEVTRADLARSYLRLEQILAEHPPQQDDIAKINRQFDAATFSFFGGKYAEALAAIDGIANAAVPGGQSNPVATSLKARGNPAVYDPTSDEPPRIRVDAIYSVESDADGPTQLSLLAVDDLGNSVASGTINLHPGSVHADVELETIESLKPGSYSLQIQAPGKRNTEIGHWTVANGSLDRARERLEERLAKISSEDLMMQQAIAAAAARVALLSDEPSETNSAQFLADPAALMESLEREINSLADSKSPYQGREGDYWRVIEAQGNEVPMRVYQPASNGNRRNIPLVVVLHGAGGDENMFMDGYGAGLIKKLAEQENFLVISPRTEKITRPKAFETAVKVIQGDYDIDPNRIYVLGHSMGGGAASMIATQHVDMVAAAVCLAGGRFSNDATEMAPTLLVAAEIDPVVPATRLEPGARKAMDAGLPVEYRLLKNFGHTLMVAHELPEAIQWLFQHKLN